jgi:hypothetical protein
LHIATKIGLFYASFYALEWFGYTSLDHVTLAMAAVFLAGVSEDSKSLAEERRKREKIRRDFDNEQREMGRRDDEFKRRQGHN